VSAAPTRDPQLRPLTLAEAVRVNPFALASHWGLPIHLHEALHIGASLEAVCAAVGLKPTAVAARLAQWVAGQRHLVASGSPERPGMEDEYARVSRVLAGYLCDEAAAGWDVSR
jgi:hypothetical protein